MDLIEGFKMAVKTLKANKLRSGLTMLGIVIGIASVIAMVGIGQGAQRLAAEQFEALGQNVLFVAPGNPNARHSTYQLPKTLVLADADAIANQVPSVSAVAPQSNTREVANFRNQDVSTIISGTTPNYLLVRNSKVDRGRFFSDLDLKRNAQVAVLGSELNRRLFGDRDPLGQTIRIKNVTFRVIGLMKPKGAFLGLNPDEAIYLPITTMASRIVGRTSPYGTELTFMSISARDDKSIEAARFQITNLLRLRHKLLSEDDFSIQAQQDLLDITATLTGALIIVLAASAGISLVVGGIGIMNIMLVSVTERTREIGLRKAIGASQRDILLQFMIEAVILSAVGGAIGVSLGFFGTFLVWSLTPLKAEVSLIAVILAVGVSGTIGLLSGIIPARQAAKLDPILALHTN
jgi:putative ABC transport system permease protein